MPAVRILPVTQQAPDAGACCGACAAESAAVPTRPLRSPRPTISRTDDRLITFGGVAAAAALLALALASILLPEAARRGLWLPLHLALAGAAGTAIASVLPFFTAALAVAPPARSSVRIAGIALVATGSLVVSGGVVLGMGAPAVSGGLLYLAGLLAVAAAAFAPLRGSLGPRRRLVETAYAAAILQVAVGAAIATAMLAGLGPIVERWALLKPAHAWLNVFGFLSIVVAATLIHLAPTVAGTRIRPRRSATVAVAGLVAGAPLIAAGLALGIDAIARLGAVVELVGAAALVVHGVAVHRDRGRWTTDPAWHRLTGWSLTAAPVWLLVAVGTASARIIEHGASPASWSLDGLAAPLALGWTVQVLVGAWSHLLPAIGPGGTSGHARQRALLGRWATGRLLALNGGVVLATVGGLGGSTAVAQVGLALVGGALAIALAVFGAAALVASRARIPLPASSRAEPRVAP